MYQKITQKHNDCFPIEIETMCINLKYQDQCEQQSQLPATPLRILPPKVFSQWFHLARKRKKQNSGN